MIIMKKKIKYLYGADKYKINKDIITVYNDDDLEKTL